MSRGFQGVNDVCRQFKKNERTYGAGARVFSKHTTPHHLRQVERRDGMQVKLVDQKGLGSIVNVGKY